MSLRYKRDDDPLQYSRKLEPDYKGVKRPISDSEAEAARTHMP